MREHGPEAALRLGRNAWSEHGNVALEVGPDEILPPVLTETIAGAEKASGKPPRIHRPDNSAAATASGVTPSISVSTIRSASCQSSAGSSGLRQLRLKHSNPACALICSSVRLKTAR
jgi:hypothetical protein